MSKKDKNKKGRVFYSRSIGKRTMVKGYPPWLVVITMVWRLLEMVVPVIVYDWLM